MGWINTRGTRAKPRYVVYYAEGLNPDGSTLYKSARAPGATSKGDAKKYLAEVEARVGRGDVGVPEPTVSRDMGDLLTEWSAALKNRGAQADRWIIQRDIIPAWKGQTIDAVTVGSLIRWLDKLQAQGQAGQTQLHRFNLVSRFFSWAVERELVASNPCRSVPRGKRPKATRDADVPWLDDDTKVTEVMRLLDVAASGLGLMFYLGRFSGMREGEIAGLRLGDLEWLAEGTIRVAHSYDGPLKEDKDNTGKSKMVPAPVDALEVLGLHLKRRKLQGAKADDLVFTYGPQSRRRKGQWATWAGFHPHTIQDEWKAVRKALGLPDALTWYHATRTTYVTKSLMAGAPLDEVSAAIGHSSPVVTKKFYDRFIRKTFAPTLRMGLAGLKA